MNDKLARILGGGVTDHIAVAHDTSVKSPYRS